MEATGSEQEQAAMTLGASGWQTFLGTSPCLSVKWGLLYGVILCNARAMGEFGAVYVVSAHIMGKTETLPLRVQSLYEDAKGETAAFAIASLLALARPRSPSPSKLSVEWQHPKKLRSRPARRHPTKLRRFVEMNNRIKLKAGRGK